MNLILIQKEELAGNQATLADDRAEHIRSVLKSKVGDIIRIGQIDGPKGTGTILELDPDRVVLTCQLEGRPPCRPSIDLLLALPRPKVLKRLWAQLAAIGVGRIILTNAWKVERNYFDTHIINEDFYRSLLVEGLQQAGDTVVPGVTVHKQFKILVEDELADLCPDSMRLVAHPGANVSITTAVDPGNSDCSVGRILLAVGPEGGWTDYEMDLLKAHQFRAVGMGERILRTDTACIALLSSLHEAVRDNA